MIVPALKSQVRAVWRRGPPMSDAEEDEYLPEVSEWEIHREGEHKISRDFRFGNFTEAMSFVNKVASLAEEKGHHPDFHIYYNKVRLELYTHAIGGLFQNDFILAAKIDILLEPEWIECKRASF